MKTLFSVSKKESLSDKYSHKVSVPQYLPSNIKPCLQELCDYTKYSKLIADINNSSLSEEEIVDKVHSYWLCADGVSSFDYEELSDYYTNIPELPEGSNCYEICWD